MTAADRIAALRAVLDIAEANPELMPSAISTGIGGHDIYWWLHGDDPARLMAAVEQALPCELTATVEQNRGKPDRYKLTGNLGGFKVEVSALAEAVADYTESTETVVKREWTRKPAEPAPREPLVISDSTIAQARYFAEHPLNDDGTEGEAQS